MTGLVTMPAALYHADPAPNPSLSSSIANLLLSASPRHAWTAHPRLNPDFRRYDDEKFDVGTVAHALLLEGESSVAVIDAADWRTKAAKEARDIARAGGQTPLLARHWLQVQAMVAATREQLSAVDVQPPLLKDGKPEQTLIWDDDGVACRARFDWARDDLTAVDDLKTTSRSANPEQWSRTMFGIGCDVQAAFYLRGLRSIGADPAWRWIVVENYPPYALSVISPGPDVLTLADAKVDRALELWRQCMDTFGAWPAYPTQVCWAGLPPWEEVRWAEREDVAA